MPPKPTKSLPKRLMFTFRHISVLPLNFVWAAQWAIKRTLVLVFRRFLGGEMFRFFINERRRKNVFLLKGFRA